MHGVNAVGSNEEEAFGLNSCPSAITKLLKRWAETEETYGLIQKDILSRRYFTNILPRLEFVY